MNAAAKSRFSQPVSQLELERFFNGIGALVARQPISTEPDVSVGEIEKFFSAIRHNVEPKQRRLETQHATRFNVFDFIEPDENRLSDVLAWLLNPKESHGQGDLFLKLLFKSVNLDSNAKVLATATVRREAPTHGIEKYRRRIDVLVEAGAWLCAFLKMKQGYDNGLIAKARHQLEKIAGDTSKSLYDRNLEAYGLLRYGVKVKPDVGENTVTVHLIDWEHPEKNDFAIAEEVTVLAADAKAHTKRPDVVIYVNGIALGVLELKRSTVSVAEGIRQNLDNQKKEFIQPFFSTVQLVLAGNDAEGLRYGSIETKEKYYLTWKESDPKWTTGEAGLLDAALVQLCNKARLLEFIHDFIVFDAGKKKLCRHNQYFAVRASQEFVRRREGGIIWNTQGSGKSLIMVWLAKWIRENVKNSRVLIITDRTELDEQIEKIFLEVKEEIYRTKSGDDLIARLNAAKPWLLCSLIHKFGGKEPPPAGIRI